MWSVTRRCVFLHFQQQLFCASRYITALTDSEEDELSDSEHDEQQRPEDKLYVLLERIDRLRQGTESDKRESLDILLEHREEVRNPPHTSFILVNNK